jgi:hypothetical protein
MILTERRSWLGIKPASYLVGPVSAQRPTILAEDCSGFPKFLQTVVEKVPQSRPEPFRTIPFQFIIF